MVTANVAPTGGGARLALVFSKRLEWNRWAGSRSDIERVVNLATASVTEWADVPASCDVSIAFRHGLTERTNEPDALSRLDADDLRELSEVVYVIRPDRDAERERAYALDGCGARSDGCGTRSRVPLQQ